MIIAAHQPNYLPNLAFFYKMAHVDHFIIFTNVQFAKGDHWVRRHKIQGVNSDLWLTVPVLGSSQNQKIRDVRICNEDRHWRHSHKETMRQSYKRTEEQATLSRILSVYEKKWDKLAELNLALILLIRDILEINTPVTFDEEVCGSQHELLVNLCEKYQASSYLSGAGGREYMTEEYFKALENCGVVHHFVEKNLTPLYPYTALHYLFTNGIAWAQSLVKGISKPQSDTQSASDTVQRGLVVSASERG